jgi:hypothetical protein
LLMMMSFHSPVKGTEQFDIPHSYTLLKFVLTS